jgi:hypothetical protein
LHSSHSAKSNFYIPAFEISRSCRTASDAGWSKLEFAERDQCRPVFLRLSLAGNLEKPVMAHYGTKWMERGYGLRALYDTDRSRVLTQDIRSADGNAAFQITKRKQRSVRGTNVNEKRINDILNGTAAS